MKIEVKSTHENFVKEKSNRKRNTLRELDGRDIICITDIETGDTVTNYITDITVWKDKIIISW